MVLFDEDPVTLIRQTTLNFHTHSDLSSLSRISTSLSTLRSARSLRLDSQRSTRSGLARRLASAQTAHADTLASHDGAAHAADILRLDGSKFRLAKGVSEVRSECERREGRVRELQREGEGMDARMERGEGEEVGEEDENVLRLRVYRGLGIDVARNEEGEFARAVVRNMARGDVSVVSIESGVERGFYADHLWGFV